MGGSRTTGPSLPIQPVEATETGLDLVANRTRNELRHRFQALHGRSSVVGIETEAGQKLFLLCGRPVEAVIPRFDAAGPDSIVAAIRALR